METNNKINQTEKSSSDVYFIAALLSMGAQISKVDREDPRHMVFTVINPVTPEPVVRLDFDVIETQWVNSTLTVNAQEYKEAIQRMKSLIHSH